MAAAYKLMILVIIAFLVSSCASPQEAEVSAPEAKGTTEIIDACADLVSTNEEISSLAEIITTAEDELSGLEIDLEFAQEDGLETTSLEEIIKSQKDYIDQLNYEMNKLQEQIKEC